MILVLQIALGVIIANLVLALFTAALQVWVTRKKRAAIEDALAGFLAKNFKSEVEVKDSTEPGGQYL